MDRPLRDLAGVLRDRLVHEAGAAEEDLAARIAGVVERDAGVLAGSERIALAGMVAEQVLGLGPLEPLLRDPRVDEVMVSGTAPVWVERAGLLERTTVRFGTEGELRLPVGSPVLLARYLTKEDDLRDDLNAHAAELETMDYSPNSAKLMEHVIQTKQLITLRKPVDMADEVLVERVLEEAARFLAGATDGVYQVDGRGWFTAKAELLVQEY